MLSSEKQQYFDATTDRPVRADLLRSVALIGDSRIAIDCGCGAGSDIAFLRSEGFHVHAFDIEQAAIDRCRQRFGDDKNIQLTRAGFQNFSYPKASLVVADASLFFCPQQHFDVVWRRITEALMPGGVFCGSFLGPEDTMAGPDYNKDAWWPDVLILNETQVRARFVDFEIVSFTEHKLSGTTPDGTPHDWHIYAVVAQKPARNLLGRQDIQTSKIRKLTTADWHLYKNIRLQSLADSPDAFGSTYEREAAYADSDWQSRLDTESRPEHVLPLIAEIDKKAVGLAWGVIHEQDAKTAHVYQMWVAPQMRGQGIAKALVNALKTWAMQLNCDSLQLAVTTNNQAAVGLYLASGFVPTGQTEELRAGSALESQSMIMVLNKTC